MGTPHFAALVLEDMLRHMDIAAVFTQPDSQSGRGNKTKPSDVKRLALSYGILVHTPQTLKNPEVLTQIRNTSGGRSVFACPLERKATFASCSVSASDPQVVTGHGYLATNCEPNVWSLVYNISASNDVSRYWVNVPFSTINPKNTDVSTLRPEKIEIPVVWNRMPDSVELRGTFGIDVVQDD